VDSLLNIAICDDESTTRSQIEHHIRKVFPENQSSKVIQLAGYSSGAELCAVLDAGGYFDLIFMDIEMEDLDGITTGQLLREKYRHDSSLLIYISSHTKYHGRLFDVQPFQFIQKPIDQNEFDRKLKLAVRKIESGNEVIIVKQGRDYFNIKKRDIISLESRKHNMILSVSGAETIEYRGVFKAEAKKLDNTFFVSPHAAFIVNINHVASFHGNHMIMDNGSVVPVSRQKSNDVKYAFMNMGEV
jgi:DNA-binding LytR/AlgR family response regulator